jgi:diaminopimelate epimerase
MNFFKFEATGNDFVIINRPYNPKGHSKEWIKALCNRNYGIGADGLFFTWSKDKEWFWRFFNQDGSEAKFCGNAARAMLLWLNLQIDTQKKDWSWSDESDSFSGRVLSKNEAEIHWPKETLKKLELKNHYQSLVQQLKEIGLEKAVWISAGVPHLVLIGSSWPKKIRQLFYSDHLTHHQEFTQESNITWLGRADMNVVSYERGLNAETLACGSGALAAYYALQLRAQEDINLKVPTTVKFQFPGGILRVRDDKEFLHLSGPVRKVFEGYYEEA